ncbi:NAD(P)H-binding protein [Yinghuangia seranimata]|uniref:NAD(P)H-binding protein n=1 Tax=Yinghuangia seranimata TaxID=408067 RepID=UPI00248BD451|nr:NAD(P)H-binding protein [Yinghuangia seranimata]MDI2127230.1 NAD(P)H-binding protein [Yinghuangia seranimata]
MFLVTGATGNVGSEVVRILARSDEPVRAVARKPDRLPLPPGVEPVAADLDHAETFADALVGVRAMFLMPGYADQAALLALARKAGVEHVVLMSGGSAAGGDRSNAVARYMIDAEQAVRDSGLRWTVVRPRAFFSNALRWLPQLAQGDEVRVPFGRVRVAALDPRDIAEVVARVIGSPAQAGRVHLVSGPQSLLPADQVATLGEVLGRELRCVELSDDEARVEMSASMAAEYVDAFFRFYVNGELDESQVIDTVETITGRRPRTFRRWAEDHADAFR